jgi:malate dehydrogenase
VAKTCPKAISCIVTNPVNSTVPVAAEALRAAGVFDPTRLFGVTTLDVVRASKFAADALSSDADPTSIKVPVIGGHSGATILPLYSQAQPAIDLGADLPKVINRTLPYALGLEVNYWARINHSQQEFSLVAMKL